MTSNKPTPAQLAATGLPVAHMRRFAFDGVDVMAMKKADRPLGWMTQDVTQHGMFPGDVALYAGPASNAALLASLLSCAAIVRVQNGNLHDDVNGILAAADEAMADALRTGVRPQTFAEREKDLLNANNRYLERAREAERLVRALTNALRDSRDRVVMLQGENAPTAMAISGRRFPIPRAGRPELSSRRGRKPAGRLPDQNRVSGR